MLVYHIDYHITNLDSLREMVHAVPSIAGGLGRPDGLIESSIIEPCSKPTQGIGLIRESQRASRVHEQGVGGYQGELSMDLV